jgi:hypothetical protein
MNERAFFIVPRRVEHQRVAEGELRVVNYGRPDTQNCGNSRG